MSSRLLTRPIRPRPCVARSAQMRDGGAVGASWRLPVPVQTPRMLMRSLPNARQQLTNSLSFTTPLSFLKRQFSLVPPAQQEQHQRQAHFGAESTMTSGNKLQEWFPNTKLPVIVSAPMLGSSNGTLAAQVSKAGGFGESQHTFHACLGKWYIQFQTSQLKNRNNLGIVPGGFDFNPDSAQLTALAKELEAARSILGLTELSLTPVPVGVGFLTCHESVGLFRANVIPVLEKYSKFSHRLLSQTCFQWGGGLTRRASPRDVLHQK